MDWIHNILPAHLTYALGWTVVHALWQGLLLASAMALLMLSLQKRQAIVRYRLAYGTLLMMFATSLVTFIYLLEKAVAACPDDFFEALVLRGMIFEATIENQSFVERTRLFFNEHLSLIVVVWLLGVGFFSVRLLGGLLYVQHLKTRHLTPLSIEWQSRLNLFKNRLGIHRIVDLAESAMVTVPMVVGWVKPLILLPIGTVNAMSVTQVEAILAHELAHIGGRDYLLNILQSVIEILFYFHPAVWWISANIRAERENRCDDIAVQVCGNSLTYAKALLSIQEMQLQNVRTYGLAMTFAGKRKNLLLKRIKRILNQPANRSNIMEKLIATGLLLAVVTALSFGGNKFQTQNQSKNAETTPSVSAPNLAEMITDTVPRKGKMTITHEDGDRKVEMKVENGEIQNLKIDGKDIPKEDFAKYEDITEEVLYGLPIPPTPPMPPMPAMPNMPPMPPMPPVFSWGGDYSSLNMKKEKDKEGNTILHLKKKDGSTSDIKITPDKEVFIDGKKVEEGKDFKLHLGDGDYHLLNKWDTKAWEDWGNDFAKKFKLDLKWDDKWDEWSDKWDNWEQKGNTYFRGKPQNFYFMDGDSLKGGVWNDSLKVYRLNDSTRRRIIIDGRNVIIDRQRIRENVRQHGEAVRQEAEQHRRQMQKLGEEQRRNGEQLRHQADELRRQAQEQARNYQQQMREQERNWREQAREAQRGRTDEGNSRWANRESANGFDGIKTAFEAQMLEDAVFTKDKKVYEIELTENNLKINGKPQSKEMFEKYQRIYEQKSGQRMRGNFSLKFSEEKN